MYSRDRLHLIFTISYYFCFIKIRLLKWYEDMTSKLRFEPKTLKSASLSKEALLLVMLDRHFHIKALGNVSKKLWAVEHHYSLSLYSIGNKEILNCIHTLFAIHWAVFIKTFHFALIPNWNLINALSLKNIQISGSTDFMRNSNKFCRNRL